MNFYPLGVTDDDLDPKPETCPFCGHDFTPAYEGQDACVKCMHKEDQEKP